MFCSLPALPATRPLLPLLRAVLETSDAEAHLPSCRAIHEIVSGGAKDRLQAAGRELGSYPRVATESRRTGCCISALQILGCLAEGDTGHKQVLFLCGLPPAIAAMLASTWMTASMRVHVLGAEQASGGHAVAD